MHLKSKFTKKPDGTINKDDISMPRKEINEYYGSYETFAKDLDSLTEHGFIRYIVHGRTGRQCNIYSFSDMWQKYDTEEFKLHSNDLRITNKKK